MRFIVSNLPQKKLTNEQLSEEIISCLEELSSSNGEEKYQSISKAILIANYGLFLGVVWKSLDLQGEISFSAKFSLLFFVIGIIFSTLRVLADYFLDSSYNLTTFKKLVKLHDSYEPRLIEALDADNYQEIKFHVGIIRWTLNKYDIDKTPPWLMGIVYFIVSIVSLAISCCCLLVGLLFLAIGAI